MSLARLGTIDQIYKSQVREWTRPSNGVVVFHAVVPILISIHYIHV
jgi:hypothetical protein